jgi:sugar/nucleoside kinase (ribokinase family)
MPSLDRVGGARRIVVFGDVIDDVVVVPAGPIRHDTDTPSSIRQRAGGSAANAASWLGAQRAAVDFVGRVGAGDVARHSEILAGFGVTPHLVGDPEHPTGAIVVIVEGNSRSMLTERGANDFLSADDVTDDLLDEASVVHFTGYSIYHGQGHGDGHAAVRRLFERAAQRSVSVSVDPASAGSLEDFGAQVFLDLIDGADLLFPNLDEGRALTGLDEPMAIAAALGERFPLVALTLGAEGVIVAEQGSELVRIPVVESTIVDPTGAGDSFVAGFLASWTADRDAVAAARAGATVAARAVTQVGGRPAQP